MALTSRRAAVATEGSGPPVQLSPQPVIRGIDSDHGILAVAEANDPSSLCLIDVAGLLD